jgi:Pyruvate/2-oxoacid:ferredoxin oxidoreductase delta subunit
MRGGMSRSYKSVGDILEWIITTIQPKNEADRTVIYRSSPESPDKTNESNRLKGMSKSIESQLKAVNTRIPKNEENSVSSFPCIDENICTGCRRCTLICPSDAIALENHIPQVDRNNCTGCGICISECPAGAIEMIW